MAILRFPSVEEATDYGLLAVGGDLEVESLLLAYRSGIFPWPLYPDQELAWFAPPKRAILSFARFHVSRSLRRLIRTQRYVCTMDADFRSVITWCARVDNRREHGSGPSSTWISEEMIEAYCELHRAGYAHSVEVYEGDEIVGGIYGVSIGRYFSGESMFHLRPNTSKLALTYLIERLSERGLTWLDSQVINPHLASLGAVEVDRAIFMELLREAIAGR